MSDRPKVVLICHEGDRIDCEVIPAWLATSFSLAGIITLREPKGAILRRALREIRRVGLVRFLDVAAFRLYYRLFLARKDAKWIHREVEHWRTMFPAAIDVPRLIAKTPNSDGVRRFLRDLAPDLMLARCKFILKPETFTIPRLGTWVLHPGICPEYRNAHGCFWALAKRDLDRVGMTLLRVDQGVDTGPIFLQASYDYDEVSESHVVIQYRAVLENLGAIRPTLLAACRGTALPVPTTGRSSKVWGQPWLTEYFRWKRTAQEAAR